MDNLIFINKKQLLDELYNQELISATEWYEALSKLINELDFEKEINSV